ncbi:MAG: cytochrome c oxidase subunit 4 [Micrococcales bacterium]|nr:cytochrome c oxidase subunit 4 [Micrococcales bacterium]
MTALVAFYSLYTARRLDSRPEDDKVANQEEADPGLRLLQPAVVVAAAHGLQRHVDRPGADLRDLADAGRCGLLMLSIIGLVFEYYRRDFAH